jgi:uncharacterized lipoprotein
MIMNRFPRITGIIVTLLAVLALAACSSMPKIESDRIDYKSGGGKLPPRQPTGAGQMTQRSMP